MFIQVPKEVSFPNFIKVDDDLPTTAEVSECNGNDEYKNEDSSSVVVVPTHKEAILALNTVHLFFANTQRFRKPNFSNWAFNGWCHFTDDHEIKASRNN